MDNVLDSGPDEPALRQPHRPFVPRRAQQVEVIRAFLLAQDDGSRVAVKPGDTVAITRASILPGLVEGGYVRYETTAGPQPIERKAKK